MTTDLDLHRVLTLSPSNAGIALAMICRALTPEQRVVAARSLTATVPDGSHDYWLRTTAALLVQGGPSTAGAGGPCTYRGVGGTACAVGLWIPDEAYREALEGRSPASLAAGWLPWLDSDRGLMLHAAECSQSMHDTAASGLGSAHMLSWADRLRVTAREQSAPEAAIDLIDAFVVESTTP